MAATSSSNTTTVPLDILTSIVRKTCAKYNWNKKDSTYTTFLKHLKNYAKDFNVSLEDMATSSISYARDIDYSSFPIFEWWAVPELKQRFQNIPYIIHVGDDNITSVIIKTGNIDCPLKEITKEMMLMLSYLGIIRVYVNGKHPIPCWPDNIVHIKIIQENIVSHMDENKIPFPKYLQEMIDTTGYTGNYTNWLPSTLTKLISASTKLENLSPNLKIFNYTGRNTDDVITRVECLPIGITKVFYTNPSKELYISEINMPQGTQYLMLGLTRIYSEHLCIRNVKELFISAYTAFYYNSDLQYNISNTNLTLEYKTTYETAYRQNIEIILEEGLEHLIIDIGNADLEFLTCIKQVPTSLKKVSIKYWYKSIHVNKYITIDTMEYTDAELNKEQLQILKNFESRFPHICISTC